MTPDTTTTHGATGGAGTRVTVTFSADSGRRYLYDDATGTIFPWNPVREAALAESFGIDAAVATNQLEATHSNGELTAARRYVRTWRDAYGAFSRSAGEGPAPVGNDAIDTIRALSGQLILVVTENCNLRCQYCVYSGAYAFERSHTTRRMSKDLACRAIDWFVHLVAPQRARHPGKQFALTFYGGEPLLNVEVVRAALEHAGTRYPGLFRPGLTTNGTLLTPANVKLLVDHAVNLAVSLDGPQAEHDRRRRDPTGRGTHARILANLERLRAEHPEYWEQNVSALSVVDYATDIEAAAAFFEENRGRVPRPMFVAMVSDIDTAYWTAASDEELQRFRNTLRHLRASYKRAQIAGQRIGDYVRLLCGFGVFQLLIRPRLNDRRLPCLPFSGACFPGRKLAVQVDGTINLCERVNGSRPIGHLLCGGIDVANVRSLIDEYQRVVLSNCHRCPVTRLCSVCYAQALGDGRLRGPAKACASVRRRAVQSLQDYVSIMEANPNADFSFESDTARVEKRLMFFS